MYYQPHCEYKVFEYFTTIFVWVKNKWRITHWLPSKLNDVWLAVLLSMHYQSHCECEMFEHFTMICSRSLQSAWSNWTYRIFRPCPSVVFLHSSRVSSADNSHKPDNAIMCTVYWMLNGYICTWSLFCCNLVMHCYTWLCFMCHDFIH